MRVFVGIPLLHQYGQPFLRLSFCDGFKQNLRLSHIEPHITLKAPQDIDERRLEDWRTLAHNTSKSFKSMQINVGGSFFITPITLALKAETKPLCSLHLALMKSLVTFDSSGVTYHEGSDYIAHVTVGRATRTLEQSDRKILVSECDQIIKPHEITVNKIRLYIRRDIEQGYETLEDIDINGN